MALAIRIRWINWYGLRAYTVILLCVSAMWCYTWILTWKNETLPLDEPGYVGFSHSAAFHRDLDALPYSQKHGGVWVESNSTGLVPTLTSLRSTPYTAIILFVSKIMLFIAIVPFLFSLLEIAVRTKGFRRDMPQVHGESPRISVWVPDFFCGVVATVAAVGAAWFVFSGYWECDVRMKDLPCTTSGCVALMPEEDLASWKAGWARLFDIRRAQRHATPMGLIVSTALCLGCLTLLFSMYEKPTPPTRNIQLREGIAG